jgi:hypothetical protein
VASFAHLTKTYREGKVERLAFNPELPSGTGPPDVHKGSPREFNTTMSPVQFFLVWYVHDMLRDPAFYNFRFEKWEELDGQRCLVARVDWAGGSAKPDEQNFNRIWVDLGRGGHPIRLEYWSKGKLDAVTHNVRLAEFDSADGRRVWLPVSGDTDTGDLSTGEILRDSTTIVRDTVRLNQGLKDERFRLDWKGPLSYAPAVERARKAYEAAARTPKSAGRRETLAETEARLDAQLVEAEAQTRMVEASSPARERFSGVQALQVGLLVLGVGLLVYVFWARRRA